MSRLSLSPLALLLLMPAAAASSAPFAADVAIDEKWAKPQEAVVFPAAFTSHVDGAIKLTFDVVAKEGQAIAVLPNPLTLQGPAGAQRSASILFVMQTPYRNGHLDETTTVTYRVVAEDPETGAGVGEPHEFALTVHTKGFYVAGPQLFGAMLAMAIAALVVRKTRR